MVPTERLIYMYNAETVIKPVKKNQPTSKTCACPTSSTGLNLFLIANKEVAGFDLGWVQQHSLVDIDHEIFSMVILSLPLIQEGTIVSLW